MDKKDGEKLVLPCFHVYFSVTAISRHLNRRAIPCRSRLSKWTPSLRRSSMKRWRRSSILREEKSFGRGLSFALLAYRA